MAVAEREIIAAAQKEIPKPFRWTTRQFYEIGERGLFESEKVILIEGKVLAMPPIKPPHQTEVSLAAEAVRTAFEDGFLSASWGRLT